MRTLIVLLISLLANILCSAQRTSYLFFADQTMSIKVFMEREKDSVKYEIHCKNVSSQRLFLPKDIRSQVYSPTLDRIDITWISGDTGLEKIEVQALAFDEEHIYYTHNFPFTPNMYIGVCYINATDLGEYSDQVSLNIGKMLFSDIANEIVVSYGSGR